MPDGSSGYLQVRCRECHDVVWCDAAEIESRLRAAGKIRAGRMAPGELLYELFRGVVDQLACPACGQKALIVSAQRDEDGWPEPRRCDGCGRPIPAERLKALPDVWLCAPCQQAAEEGRDVGPVEYCPRCGEPLTIKLSGGAGVTRYRRACTGNPPCRLG